MRLPPFYAANLDEVWIATTRFRRPKITHIECLNMWKYGRFTHCNISLDRMRCESPVSTDLPLCRCCAERFAAAYAHDPERLKRHKTAEAQRRVRESKIQSVIDSLPEVKP